MKLFQRLLVAPAALGLMAPVAANADTAFSSTTTLGGSAVFTVGSVSDAADGEELYSVWKYVLGVKSSFTGEDLLVAGIKSGVANGPLGDLDSSHGSGEKLGVKDLYYTFPVGELSITGGPLLDQDDVVAATTSAYSGALMLGTMPFSLAGNETGAGIALAYAGDSGIVSSLSFVSATGSDPEVGINSDDSEDVTTFSLGYDGEGFGGGIVYATNEDTFDGFGGGIYYTPEALPATFSIAFDTTDSYEGTGVDASDLFVGVDYEVGPGTLSAGYSSLDVDGGDDSDTTGFEVYYAYPVNDSVTITPGFFTVEVPSAEDETGVVLETAFSF